ncbi:MAG: gamma-glutamylcyclotransferase [Opitutales bacterium]
MADELQSLRVFVYGTLQPDGHYWDAYCEGKVTAWTPAADLRPQLAWPARVRGMLYALDPGYPALVAGESWAHGCVLCLRDADGLRGFDALEDYDPFRSPALNEYNRHAVTAFSSEGPTSYGLVWTYVMQPETAQKLGGVRLPGGRWPVANESGGGLSMAHRD